MLGVKYLWRRVDAGLFSLNKMLGLLRCQTPSRHLRHAQAVSLVHTFQKYVYGFSLRIRACIIHKVKRSSQ